MRLVVSTPSLFHISIACTCTCDGDALSSDFVLGLFDEESKLNKIQLLAVTKAKKVSDITYNIV